MLGSEHQMENNSGGLQTGTTRWRTTVMATDQQQQSWWVNFRRRTIVMGIMSKPTATDVLQLKPTIVALRIKPTNVIPYLNFTTFSSRQKKFPNWFRSVPFRFLSVPF